VLVGLLLFNALGFYVLYVGVRFKVNRDVVQRLDDQDYVDDETVTLKVPLVLPYHIELSEYERVDGEIEHEGQTYRLVKQKHENDTLFIVCYRDSHSQQIKQVLADYVKTFTDRPADHKHQTKDFTGFLKDFLPAHLSFLTTTEGWSRSLDLAMIEKSLSTTYLPVDAPPPWS
jgi:hypothetical protein